MSNGLLSVDLKCKKTGVYLGVFNCTIIEGSTLLMQSVSDSMMIHPFFGLSDHVLLSKFDDAIDTLINDDWVPRNKANIQKLQVLTVAIIDRLGCYVSRYGTIPSEKVAIASCMGIRSIAKWFLYETSKRPMFPSYCPAYNAESWESLRGWIWSCFEIREDYTSRVRRIYLEAEQKARQDAAKEAINNSVGYKKSDYRKIWNWIELQLDGNVHPKRIKTFKQIFLMADLEPELWNEDDVEDLQIEIIANCDESSSVYSFALHRCRALADYLSDFYGSFTMVTSAVNGASTELEKQRTDELTAELDAKLDSLPELVAPKESDFLSRALFMKAQAEYKLLSMRRNSQRKDKS